jgi:soluble lytic murein transglycosylase
MNILNRYKYHILALVALIVILFMSSKTTHNPVTQNAEELPHVLVPLQLRHALELFPEQKASLAMLTGGESSTRQFILDLVKNSLPEEQKSKAFAIAHAVISEANHHHMDPLFLLAVIKTESQFNVAAHGSHGEIGLMQILPQTARQIAAQAGLNKKLDLKDPAINIRIGATYFALLRHKFNHRSTRYLAAYNMGSRHVRRLLATNTEPQIYPTRVLNNYEQIYLALRDSGNMITVRTVASVR